MKVIPFATPRITQKDLRRAAHDVLFANIEIHERLKAGASLEPGPWRAWFRTYRRGRRHFRTLIISRRD